MCLAQLLFCAFPILFGYLSPASVVAQDSGASVIPGLGSYSVARFSPDSSPSWDGRQQDGIPVSASTNWQRPELGVCSLAFWHFSWQRLRLPLHLEFRYCVIWALSQYLRLIIAQMKKLRCEYAFLCALILVMGCSDLTVTCFFCPLDYVWRNNVFFTHFGITVEFNHPGGPHF